MGGLRFVHTPGFVLDGQVWLGFRQGDVPVRDHNRTGSLTVRICENDIVVDYRPSPEPNGDPLTVNIALLGFCLTSEIRAGENKGRFLRHDFVVMDRTRKSLTDMNGVYAATAPHPRTDVGADRYAIAVWVSALGEQAPLQAVGAWFDANDTAAREECAATGH